MDDKQSKLAYKGSEPGSLIFVGEQKMSRPRIKVINFDDQGYSETSVPGGEQIFDHVHQDVKSWVNIDGIHDTQLIEAVGKKIKLDPLLLEDILDTTQRPKCDAYENHLFIVLRMIRYDDIENVTMSEQFSMVLGHNYLFTFQEVQGDVFEGVRERLKKDSSKIRSRKIDFLAYALIDTLVDNYIYAIEKFGDKIDDMDKHVLVNPQPSVLEDIYHYKREINYLRKAIRPVREVVLQLEKSEFIDKNHKAFLKDLLDHISLAIEGINTYRDLLTDQLNVYHSNMSIKTNEVIRLLTIYSVIFIPITFIAGVYGMNFTHFPELDHQYSYPIFWILVVLISGSMIIYFKRKGWL